MGDGKQKGWLSPARFLLGIILGVPCAVNENTDVMGEYRPQRESQGLEQSLW